MAACVLVGIITTLLAPEPDTDELAPQSLRTATIGALRDFFTRPYALGLLIFIIFYKLGDAYAQSLTSVFFLKTIGFSLAQIAWVAKTFGLTASMLGIFLAGALMSRMRLFYRLVGVWYLTKHLITRIDFSIVDGQSFLGLRQRHLF